MKAGCTIQALGEEIFRQSKAKEDYQINTDAMEMKAVSYTHLISNKSMKVKYNYRIIYYLHLRTKGGRQCQQTKKKAGCLTPRMPPALPVAQ